MFLTRRILLVAAAFFSIAVMEDKINAQATQVSDLIHPDGTATDTVIEILGYAGVRIKGFPTNISWPDMVAEIDSPSCEDIKNLIQGKDTRYPTYSWRAQPNVERWDMHCGHESVHEQQLLDLILTPSAAGIKGLNMGAATYPKTACYSEILLFGSTLGDFSSRVDFLNTLTNEANINLDATSIYILTGKRTFNASEKDFLTSNGTPNALEIREADREKNGLEWIYKRHPKDPRLTERSFITIDDADPAGPRASTESTLTLFFEQTRSSEAQWGSKKILGVSTHIFALYQYLILKRVAFQNGFTGHVDICAPALLGSERDTYSNNQKRAMLLDNLARIFYEICLYKEKTREYPS